MASPAAVTSTTPSASTKATGKSAKKASRTTSPVNSDLPQVGANSAGMSNAASAAASASQAIAAANLAAAVQMAASLQLNGLLSLLTPSSGGAAADPTVLQTSSLVTAASLSSSSAAWQVPTPEQARQAAVKAVQENPPFVHLSKTDSAPQLKIMAESDRLAIKGGMRGYRMSRATHGVSQGYYYFEVLVLPPPPISEIVANLPANARLGPTLQKQIQQALEYEKQYPNQPAQGSSSSAEPSENQKQQQSADQEGSTEGDSADTAGKKRKTDESTEDPATTTKKSKSDSAAAAASAKQPPPPPQVGGHLRIGWSMRTGDLQAPVGYDKWSYGYRSISGSKIHQSRREDNWGGEEIRAGDVLGCAIFLSRNNNNKSSTAANSSSSSGAASNASAGAGAAGAGSTAAGAAPAATGGNLTNHIRFFKNGVNLGNFFITKGKREGGAAFEDIEPGTYYPAVSPYLGGACQVNFGPHFIFPPRKLPHGIAKHALQPISSIQPPPLSEEEILVRLKKKAIFAKTNAKEKETPETKMASFREAVLAETKVLQHAYKEHRKKHLEFVRDARKARNLTVTDLQQELDKILESSVTKETPGEDGGTAASAGDDDTKMES